MSLFYLVSGIGQVVTFFCIGTVLPALGQSTNTGAVVGTVADSTGAVLDGADVSLTDPSVHSSRSATSNSAGRYIFVDVPPGNYELSFSKQGFSTAKTHITVEVGQALSLNMVLKVGGTSIMVEVTAVGNELQTMNATVGNTINNLIIDNLPALGRDEPYEQGHHGQPDDAPSCQTRYHGGDLHARELWEGAFCIIWAHGSRCTRVLQLH